MTPVTEAQKGCFCVSNGSVTHRKEGFAKQTQVMLPGGWLSEVDWREIGALAQALLVEKDKKGILHTKKYGEVWYPRERVKDKILTILYSSNI